MTTESGEYIRKRQNMTDKKKKTKIEKGQKKVQNA